MKKISLLAVTALTGIIMIACQKENSNSQGNETKLLASKESVNTGGSVSFQLQNRPNGSVSKWTVSPATGVNLDSIFSRQNNTITFTQPGTYTVSTEIRWVHPNCMPSPGYDTCYNSGTVAGKLMSRITVKN
jgi:plastocyanin